MRDLLADYEALLSDGAPVGRAVVTKVFGSAPQPEGATLLANAAGRMAGSVSGGCVEAATVEAIREAIALGAPKLVAFSVSDELAWQVGLSCGGTIEVLIEPAVRRELLAAAGGPGGVVLATVVEEGDALGAALVVDEEGGAGDPLPPVGNSRGAWAEAMRELASVAGAVESAARHALAREASRTERFESPGGHQLAVFLEVFPRPPRLVVFGAVHVAAELVKLAHALGYRTIVADGRPALLTRERFPDADELVLGWPEEAFGRAGLDRATYVCVLTHDPKFDDPALLLALRSPAAYVGAIGSRKTQAARLKRLSAAGLSDSELARLRGPIGLDLGGRRPAETALAILAEMTAVRYGATAQPMRELQGSRATLSRSSRVNR